MTIVANNSITVSNVNDGTITYTAYAYSADGSDRFTTVYPNLNLLDGTRDFSGTWGNPEPWSKNGTYNGLTVMSYNGAWNTGIYKSFLVPSDGIYSLSLLCKVETGLIGQFVVEATGVPPKIVNVNPTDGKFVTQSYTNNFTAGQTVLMYFRFESNKVAIKDGLSVAGHKIEPGSTATPWMPSSSEATTADYPSYIGQYSDFTSTVSIDPAKYAPWTIFKGNDGIGVTSTDITYAISTSGTTAPSTGWTSAVPTVPAGSYLWTKTVWAYTDNTSETGYSVAMMGVKGDKGDPGTPGTPGTPGQNGADAWSVIMSNENVTLPANAQGGVLGYANSGTSISVMYGTGTAFTPAASGATLANNQFKVSASASNITAGTQTVDTTNKKINYTVASGMNTTSGAVASITYTISIRNSLGVTSTVTKVQNFTKAEKGITGDKGIDSYTYIRYSASSNGASMTSLPGADSYYIGTCTTTQATAPTTAVSYVWAKFVGADGVKGDPTGITRSTTEPATRYTGMLWQYTGTANLVATGITALPSSLYVWTGSAWQLYLVKSTNLQVDNGFITNAMIGDATIESAKIKSLEATKINANNLAAISANLGDITGGSYTSWTVDIHPSGDPILNGIYMYNGRLRSVSIINPISIDPKEVGGIINSSISGMEMFGGYTDYYYGEYNLVNGTAEDMIKGINGMSFWSQRNDTGAYIGRIVGFQLPDKDPYLLISTPRLLVAGDIDVAGDISIGSGQITAEALTNKGWQNVTGFVNGVQNDNVPLQYKVTINMDNTRTIKFRGGFKGNGTSDLPQDNIVQLPVEARPTTTIAFPCMGSGARLARITIDTNGWIQFNVAYGTTISGFKAVLLSNVFYEI